MKILLLSFSLVGFLFLTSGVKAASSVVINEVLPNPSSASSDEWIELYNSSATEVDLSGWQLDDVKDAGTRPYTIPDGTKIAPGSFLVFEKNTTKIGLNNSYDIVRLVNNDGVEIDSFEYESAREDVSFARSPDGASTWIETSPTKGLPNPKPPKTSPKGSSGSVSLSEFSPAPKEGQEWVELYNPNSKTIDISGWKIDDVDGGSKPFTIPPSTKIKSKGYAVFYFSSKLNNTGDTLRLINPSGKLTERYSYQKVEKGTIFAKDSQGRWKITTTPTPGKKNKITGASTSTDSHLVGSESGSSLESPSQAANKLAELPQILGVEDPNSLTNTSDDRPVKTQFAGSKDAVKEGPFSTILIGLGLILLGAAFGLPILQGNLIAKGQIDIGKADGS